MKKNFKKILLGVGIGSVMCASTLFTGCTGAFTEDQNEDMMEVLENVEQFMDTTSKDLENMDSSMKDIVNQLHMLNKEDAFKLYNYAINSIYINKDNVWDNLKITNNKSFAEETQNSTNEVLLYKKDNKNYIAYSQKTKTSESNYYHTDNGLNAEKSEFTYRVADVLLEYVFHPVFFNLESEDLINVSILENGNYLLKFNKGNFTDSEKESTIVDVEITQEGKMIGASYWFGDAYLPSTDSGKLNSAHYDFEFKYGEVTESEVNAVIDKADAQN